MKNHLNYLLAIVILIIMITVGYLVAEGKKKTEAQFVNCTIMEAKHSLMDLPEFCWGYNYRYVDK